MIGQGAGDALRLIAGDLRSLGKRFALVGGFGVSLRAEVRFTRDVDIAVALENDAEAERLVLDLRARGYEMLALVEQDEVKRLATIRLRSPAEVTVDLLAASCGIEGEVVARATSIAIEGIGEVPVAQAEELLAMKVLSVTSRRLQDRTDALRLIQINESLDLARVRDNLKLIKSRGFHRKQDLMAKLEELVETARS